MQRFYTSSSDKVYNRLLADIFSGKIAAGEKLGEDAISTKMKVSRTPVREAMQRLTQEGLIERIPRCGCFVKAQDRNQLVEVFECRQILECQALDSGFERISERHRREMKKLIRKIDIKEAVSMLEISLQMDDLLHGMIVDICPNKLMKELILKLQQQSNPLRVYRSLNIEEIANITQERICLLKAISAGEKKKALKLLAQHICIPSLPLEGN